MEDMKENRLSELAKVVKLLVDKGFTAKQIEAEAKRLERVNLTEATLYLNDIMNDYADEVIKKRV